MGFNGKLKDDNATIAALNEEILKMKEEMLSYAGFSVENYILDFEDYEIEVLFGDNKKKALIVVEDDAISVKINGNTVKVGADGSVIQ